MIEERLQHVDLVVGCSKYITSKIHQCFPDLSDRCCTIYNGAYLSQFSPQDDLEVQKNINRILLFVRRLSPEKGVYVLLDAFGILVKGFPDAHLQVERSISSSPPKFLVSINDDKQVQDLSRL